MQRWIFSAVVFLSCGQLSQFGSDSTTSSQGTSDAVPAAQPSANARVIPYHPEPDYTYAKSVAVDNQSLLIDMPKFRASLTALAIETGRANSAETGAVCICGCSVRSQLYLLPAMRDLYPAGSDLDAYQVVKSCSKLTDGTFTCSSEPDEWTKRGWEEFAVDLMDKLASRDVAVSSAEAGSVDIEKILNFLRK